MGGDLGRRYASISEDYNPIHMSAVTAYFFGFSKGCIAHGLWTSARTMGLLQTTHNVSNKLTGNAHLELYVEFKLPIFLPSAVVLADKEDSDGGHTFQVVSAKNKTIPHMKGYFKAHKK